MSQNSRVARGALLIMVITLFGKLAGFAREQVIAGYFGATGLVDAYISAYSVPLLIHTTILTALSTSFIPVFLRWKSGITEHEAWALLGGLLKSLAVGLTAIAVSAFLAAPAIIQVQAPGLSQESARLAVALLRVMVPGTVFSGLASILVALLNAHHRFGWSALSPLILSLGTVGGAVLLVPLLGVNGLAWATLLGMALQLLALCWQVHKRQYPIVWSGPWIHPGVKQLVTMSGPIFVSTACMQAYLVVNRWLAVSLQEGSLAALTYANKLVYLPVGLFVTAVSTAIYPTLAEFSSNKNYSGYKTALSSGFRFLLLIIAPAATGLFALRVPIVQLTFERGAFDQAATMRTAWVLAYAAFGLVGQACTPLLNNAFYSRGDSKTPVRVSVAFAVTNTLLSVVLVRILNLGGLALATTISQFISVAFLIHLSKQHYGVSLGSCAFLLKIAASCLIMGILSYRVYSLLRGSGLFISLGVASLVGLVVYFGLIAVLSVEDLDNLLGLLGKKRCHKVNA